MTAPHLALSGLRRAAPPPGMGPADRESHIELALVGFGRLVAGDPAVIAELDALRAALADAVRGGATGEMPGRMARVGVAVGRVSDVLDAWLDAHPEVCASEFDRRFVEVLDSTRRAASLRCLDPDALAGVPEADLFPAAPPDDVESARIAWNLLRPFRSEQFLGTARTWDGRSPLYGRDGVVPCFGAGGQAVEGLKVRARLRAFPDGQEPTQDR